MRVARHFGVARFLSLLVLFLVPVPGSHIPAESFTSRGFKKTLKTNRESEPSFRGRVKAQNLWRPPKCPAWRRNPLGRVSRRRDSFTVGAWTFIRDRAHAGGLREFPLTRVELRRHCSRDSTICRFLATVYQVHRHYVRALEMKTFPSAATLRRGSFEYYACRVLSLRCLQAINTPSCRCKSMREGDCWLFMIFAVIKIQCPLILREKNRCRNEKGKTVLEDCHFT